MPPTVLVTGARGKSGLAVTRACCRRGLRVIALIRRPEQKEAVAQAGASLGMVGDFLDLETLVQAASEADVVYHIPPNVHPNELEIGQYVIRAAQASGAALVYHSVLHPQTQTMPHHWLKLRVEEQLLESSLVFTILQPEVYMQNVLANRAEIQNLSEYRVPYPISTRLNLVDLEDVAAAAAVVLSETRHNHATCELAGPQALSPSDIAAAITAFLGRKVRAVEVPIASWAQEARTRGLDAQRLNTLVNMFQYYAEFGFSGNSQVLSMLLERQATTFEHFLKRDFAPFDA